MRNFTFETFLFFRNFVTNVRTGKWKKIDIGIRSSRFILETLHSFSLRSFYRHRCSLQALLGTTRTEVRRRRKFIKYLKVRKRLLSPAAINFHLHFIFVSFVMLEKRNGARTNDEGWGEETAKGESGSVRWLKCRRGISRNVLMTNDNFFVHRKNCSCCLNNTDTDYSY